MRLWHDDIRRPPDDTWEWARTNEEALALLRKGDVEEASLDHDLGLHDFDPDVPEADMAIAPDAQLQPDGKALVRAMIEEGLVPPKVRVHSWNPFGAETMASLIEDAIRVGVCGPCKITVKPFCTEWRSK